MAIERTPGSIAQFRQALARIENRMTATMQGRHSARMCKLRAMRATWPDLPRSFWVATSKLSHDDLRAVSDALDACFAAGVARRVGGGQ